MQEGVLFKTDVHKGSLQTVFQVLDFAFENAADEAFVAGAFDGKLLEFALLDHGDARLEPLGVDDDLLVEFFDRLNEFLNFLDDLIGDDLDGVHQALRRLFLDMDGLEARVFLHFSRDGEVGFAEVAFFVFAGVRRFGDSVAISGQSGGEVFGALNLAFVASAVEDRLFSGFFTENFGAGIAGRAVGALDVGGHSTAGTEPVAAAAAGKASFTHNQ